jgi:hypothetical protein
MMLSRRAALVGLFCVSANAAVGQDLGPSGPAVRPSATPPGEILDNKDLMALYEALGYDVSAVYGLFQAVRSAFQKQDITAFADLCLFPLLLFANKERRAIANRDDVEARREAIFSPPVRETVERQQFQSLGVSDHGIMYGSGQLWLQARCQDRACKQLNYGVATINAV